MRTMCFTPDQKKRGILASVSLAQFILESGYGKSELAQNANNLFGMKKSLSGNTWNGSALDGKVVYKPKAAEPAVKVPFLVKVSICDLNIRKGPGTEYGRVQFCPPGIYTIMEVKVGQGSKAGWGRLKSGMA